jgi:hypothetical protein
VIYYVAVWFGTLMLLAGQPWAFRAAAAMMTVGLVGIVREVIRARRLADVESRCAFRTAPARRFCCVPEAEDETKEQA